MARDPDPRDDRRALRARAARPPIGTGPGADRHWTGDRVRRLLGDREVERVRDALPDPLARHLGTPHRRRLRRPPPQRPPGARRVPPARMHAAVVGQLQRDQSCTRGTPTTRISIPTSRVRRDRTISPSATPSYAQAATASASPTGSCWSIRSGLGWSTQAGTVTSSTSTCRTRATSSSDTTTSRAPCWLTPRPACRPVITGRRPLRTAHPGVVLIMRSATETRSEKDHSGRRVTSPKPSMRSPGCTSNLMTRLRWSYAWRIGKSHTEALRS